MKITQADLKRAHQDLLMLAYYPQAAEAQAAIMRLLAKMCPHREALAWLTDTMVNRVGTWKGPAELRGVLCTRYRPADGIEMDSSVPGFTAADGEARSIEVHEERMRELEAMAPKLLKEVLG